MCQHRHGPCASERGSALILSLLATTLLLVLGSALALLAQTESSIAAAGLREVRATGAAEAALRHAVADLEALPDWSPALSGAALSTMTDGPPSGVRTLGRSVIDVSALGATFNAAAAALPFGANNPYWSPYLWAPGDQLLAPATWEGYVVVWLADDLSEIDDDPRQDGGGVERRGRGVLRLRAVAFDGFGSRRMVEATVVRLVSGRVRLLMGQAVR